MFTAQIYRGLGFSHLKNSSFLILFYNIGFLGFKEFHISCENSTIFVKFHFEEFSQSKSFITLTPGVISYNCLFMYANKLFWRKIKSPILPKPTWNYKGRCVYNNIYRHETRAPICKNLFHQLKISNQLLMGPTFLNLIYRSQCVCVYLV